MNDTGIPPLDELLGGFAQGRLYLIAGASGTGKSIAALQFLGTALERGVPVALLTDSAADDVLAQADFLGLRPEAALRSGQFTLITYQPEFSTRVSCTPSPALVLDELKLSMGAAAPRRLVIDSIAPFLDARSSSASLIGALVACIEDFGATTLLTIPGEPQDAFDLRLEPVVQRAHAIVRFSATAGRERRMEIVKTRFEAPSDQPVSFRIEAGLGVTGAELLTPTLGLAPAPHTGRLKRAGDSPSSSRQPLNDASGLDPTPFSILWLAGSDVDVRSLLDTVRREIGSKAGDFACIVDGRVVVYLRGAQRSEATFFLARVGEIWRRDRGGEIHASVMSYPADAERANDHAKLAHKAHAELSHQAASSA